MSANTRSLHLLPSAFRGRGRVLVVAMLAAVMGWAAPAVAQSTTDDPSVLSDYGNTGPTGSESTDPVTPYVAPTTTEEETTAAPDRGGQLGDEASGGEPAPSGAVAGTTASGNDPVVAGSTGRPARLAYTGAEPLLVGVLGAGMLLGAGVLHRRRRQVAD